MKFSFQFGQSQAILEIPGQARVNRLRYAPVGKAIDYATEIDRVLNAPIDSPPFERAFTPDDRITLVVDNELPSLPTLLAPILRRLQAYGISQDRLCVLLTPPKEGAHLSAWKLDAEFAKVTVRVHDPADKSKIAYLASTKNGERIYLDRDVVDIDAVIVIGRSGFDRFGGLAGVSGIFFPLMSDSASLIKHEQRAIESGYSGRTTFGRVETDEVAWLAGLYFAILLEVERDQSISQCWAGHYPAVQSASDLRATNRLLLSSKGRGDLVLASLASRDRSASWCEVALALESAAQVAPTGTPIVLLSDLSAPPGRAIQLMSQTDNAWELLAQVRKVDSTDALSAAQIARVLSHHKVYLYSKLPTETIEALGLGAVGDLHEVENVLSKANDLVILEDADLIKIVKDAPPKRSSGS